MTTVYNSSYDRTMVRLRSLLVKSFVYVAFMMSAFFLFSFIWLERSTSKDVFLYGPDIMPNRNLLTRAPDQSEDVLDALFTSINRDDALGFVNCRKLFHNDDREMETAVSYLRRHNYRFPTWNHQLYKTLTLVCERFKRSRGYLTFELMEDEREFPLAFTILMHDKIEQFERLLRAIYRPNNHYCVHVDGKVSTSVLESVTAIAACFENVFIVSKQEIVVYRGYTRLQADINCMKDLVNISKPWKYLINMAASEFPIMTNLQMVRIAKLLNGGNDIHEVFMTMDETRFMKRHFTYIDKKRKTGHIIYTDTKKDPPPHGIKITKGNAYNLYSRDFVDFVLTDRKAKDLLQWSKDTLTPDEHYWATLNNLYSNPELNTPGGFKGHPDKKSYFGRYIGWNSSVHRDRCKARHYVHNVCVFSVQDLPAIRHRIDLIANKFDIEYDPLAYRCMEEWLRNKTFNFEGIRNERLYLKNALIK